MQQTKELIENTSFWSLPEEVRQLVKDSAPDQDAWTFEMKRRDDGYWEFDFPELKTYGELMVGGTEKIFDTYYTQQSDVEPDEWSTMTVVVSRVPFDGQITSFTKTGDDRHMEGASYYRDDISQEVGWLCPWLLNLWDPSPDKLYFSIEVTS